MMTIREARNRTAQWVEEQGSKMPGYAGALFAGSINRKSPEEMLPEGSDVDVFIVVDQDDTSSIEVKKFHHRGLVLETACYPAKMFRNPEIAIADFRVACHLAAESIISDPTGILARAHEFALREYPRRAWIRKRCEGLFEWIEYFAANPNDRLSPPLSLWQQWTFFPVTAGQAVAVADLLDPTVKRSLVVSHDVLSRYRELATQDLILEVGGYRSISAREVERYLDEYLQVLDPAIECRARSFPGSNWVSAEARQLIHAGVTDMIRAGHHREVMCYLAQVSFVALAVIDTEASEAVKQEAVEAYFYFMSCFGIKDEEDHRARIEKMREALKVLKATTERIIQSNPNAFD